MNHRVSSEGLDLKDQVVAVNRVTKVVKGGKNFSFSALVVVGDGRGVVGFGQGKAKEASAAVTKGTEAAKKALIRVPLVNGTVPHETIGRYGRGRIVIRPASTGTGVIAGGAARAIMELAGVQNVLTKSIGTSNPHNLVRATIAGLMSLRSLEDVARARGKAVEEIGSDT